MYGVREVPVCTNGKIVGYVEMRDLLAETMGLRALAMKKVSERYKLRDVEKRPVTIEAISTIGEAIKVMADNNIAVVENGRLVAVF